MGSNQKGSGEGGRDENCRRRSARKATKHRHVRHRNRELTERVIRHEGNVVREFYVGLEGPVVVGLEATGSMQWFLELLDELGIQYRVGHPAKIRAAERLRNPPNRS